jgi:hypothetical protein
MAEEKDLNELVGRFRQDIDQGRRASGLTRSSGAITDSFLGFDHRRTGSTHSKNTDNQGFVFFTRPILNLSYNNLLQDRTLLPFLTDDPMSFYSSVRVMLDSWLSSSRGQDDIDTVTTKLFDDRQAFMPILSNALLSLEGFNDITLDTYTAPEGKRRESFYIVDDIAEINNIVNLTANFQNLPGDPISIIFYLWARYMGNVYIGEMDPYPSMIVENEIDYQTRIWRIITDETKRWVKKIGCSNACVPLASPLGASYNYQAEQRVIEDNDQISIPFRCVGSEYGDPILVDEFNRTVADFNPAMEAPWNNGYQLLEGPELVYLNNYGFPRIDPRSMELQWWLAKDEYQQLMES